MAVGLHRRGVFDWGEWCDALAGEIAAAQAAGNPDLGDTYYHHWLSALEGLVARKAVTDVETLRAVREDWRAADHHRGFGEAAVLVRGAGEHDHRHGAPEDRRAGMPGPRPRLLAV